MTKARIAAGLVAGKRAAADGQRVYCPVFTHAGSNPSEAVWLYDQSCVHCRRCAEVGEGGTLGAGWYNADELVDLMWLAEGEYYDAATG